jgi:uncharacterized protein YecE (DUF72 family)
VVRTADFAYFRLRDEGYVAGDIARWAKQIESAVTPRGDTYVYFKHEESGLGPQFARQLLDSMGASAADKRAG